MAAGNFSYIVIGNAPNKLGGEKSAKSGGDFGDKMTNPGLDIHVEMSIKILGTEIGWRYGCTFFPPKEGNV